MALLAAPILSLLVRDVVSARGPYTIVKLGTVDVGMVETTPVLWKGQLLRFESVRAKYNGLTQRDPAMGTSAYFRFRHVSSQIVTPSFARGYAFGSAHVQPATLATTGVDTMWVFGVYYPNWMTGSRIHVDTSNATCVDAFQSTDLQTWTQSRALTLDFNSSFAKPPFGIYNNAVAREGDSFNYVMAVEIGGPWDGSSPLAGHPYTSIFARVTGPDLSKGWSLLDPTEHVYTKQAFSACPTIRRFGEYFYVATLFRKPHFQIALVRSKDLMSWEGPYGSSPGSPFNPILSFVGEEARDRAINPDQWNYKTNFTSAMKDLISNAVDINNSDIDFCDDGRGGVYISYSWGNQRGSEFLAAAMIPNCSVKEWLESYFDEQPAAERSLGGVLL